MKLPNIISNRVVTFAEFLELSGANNAYGTLIYKGMLFKLTLNFFGLGEFEQF